MINELIIILFGTILAFIAFAVCLVHLYKREQRRADILQEQLEIRRQIERGEQADKILWKYHNVTYLNNAYNVKVKNIQKRHRTLQGGQ